VLAKEEQGLPGPAGGLVLRSPTEVASLGAGQAVEASPASRRLQPEPLTPGARELEGEGLLANQAASPQASAPEKGGHLRDQVIEGDGVHAALPARGGWLSL
jgi:hypothetical protein